MPALRCVAHLVFHVSESLFLIFDVRTGAEPFDDLSIQIAHGQRAP
jgi:hypothetical protein